MNRRLRWLATMALLPALYGCVGGDGKFSVSHWAPLHKPAPAAEVSLIQTMWENRVVETEDTVNHGAPLYGLAGRAYLFGSKLGYPLHAKGTLTVTSYEVLPDNTSRPLEVWEIDPATLQRLGSGDLMGWGYTLFLPFTKYRPEVKRVQIQVKYVPVSGNPIYSPRETVSLADEGPPIITSNILPVGGVQKK